MRSYNQICGVAKGLDLIGDRWTLLIAGVGVSMAFPAAPAAALGAVAPADTGKASGANSTMQRFGGAFGVAIATAVFSADGHLGSAAAFVGGFRPGLATVAALSGLGAAASLAVRARRSAVSAGSSQPAPEGAPAPAALAQPAHS